MYFFSPLEQFQVLPIFSIFFNYLGLTVTNEAIILLLIFLYFTILYYSFLMLSKDGTFFLIPQRWQVLIELLYLLILSLIFENIKNKSSSKFFPFIFSLFIFVLTLNLIGLIPFSFTLSSHLVITLSLSISTFIGINIISIKKYGLKFFSLFLPGGTSTVLAFLLVPIEMISYIFKPISLSIRLFANMMAGHTLLKVIAGFSTSLMTAGGVYVFIHYIPLLILIPLFFLELAVALIQSFVFSILICIYINDSINISH